MNLIELLWSYAPNSKACMLNYCIDRLHIGSRVGGYNTLLRDLNQGNSQLYSFKGWVKARESTVSLHTPLVVS